MLRIDLFAINLRDQDVRDGVQNTLRSRFQQVGDTEVKLVLAKPDGVVDAGKREEADVNLGHHGARTQFSIGATEDFDWSGDRQGYLRLSIHDCRFKPVELKC